MWMDFNAGVVADGEQAIDENGAQMKKRVLQAFSNITEHTCIITHGGVIDAIMEHLFPDEGKNRYEWQPKPGCGYAVTEHCYRALP